MERFPIARSAIAAVLLACHSSSSVAPTTTATKISASTASGLRVAKWGTNVTIAYADGYVQYQSNGLPNHARQAQYALPSTGVMVPSATTAYAGADPTLAQNYNFRISTNPTKASATTSTSGGTIGVMISGASLFNPYEGDQRTVAMASNFTVKNASGADIAFLDNCNGHPTPMGMYHYHALPPCVTSQTDVVGGPSHIIGIAFDGFPIYGDRDAAGKQVTIDQLDACNGVTSATPEFPTGIYHYVLLQTGDSRSSIRCFSGTVDATIRASLVMEKGMMVGR